MPPSLAVPGYCPNYPFCTNTAQNPTPQYQAAAPAAAAAVAAAAGPQASQAEIRNLLAEAQKLIQHPNVPANVRSQGGNSVLPR